MNNFTGMPRAAVVIGASSDIARAVLRLLAVQGLTSVVLAGRRHEELEETARQLSELGVNAIELVAYEASDLTALHALVAQCIEVLGQIDLVLVAVGQLDPPHIDLPSPQYVAAQITTNFSGPAAAIAAFATRLREQRHGHIVVLSSAAAARVRRGLLVYGSAKAGLDGFCQGLGDMLEGSGVDVTIVRPGYVHTKMTAGRRPLPLATDVGTVAATVVRGIERRARIVWSPPILRVLFAVVVHLPAKLWRRLSS